MNRHTGFPPDTRAGVVLAEAIPEPTGQLRLGPGSTLPDAGAVICIDAIQFAEEPAAAYDERRCNQPLTGVNESV